MSGTIAAWVAVAVVAAGTAYNGYEANKANQQQRSAQRESLKQANVNADLADQANNKANAKSPDIMAMLASNSAKGAAGSTMLTGPSGVDPSGLMLGKNTLLGG